MLLDTCALLWLAHDQSKISPDTLKRIEKASVISVSSIVGFEIGIKCRAGKLWLPVPPQQWISEILEHHRIGVIDLSMDICVKATELPPIHKDPCDRFIIATALTHDLITVTADQRFAAYGVNVLI